VELAPAVGAGRLLVISGWRGVGKTLLCEKLAARARQAGRTVAGVLSVGRFVDGKKNGFLAVDLATRETRLLASVVPGEVTGLRLGPWAFDRAVFAWGNQILKQSAGAEWLFIDEIGPLEFEWDAGWSAGFEVLRRQAYGRAVAVIRPECLGAFANLGLAHQTLEVTPGADLDHLAESLL
jgi:nucleoside-triphosphatase THEP1